MVMRWLKRLHGDGGCLNKIKLLSQIFIFSFGVENVIIQISKGSIQEKFLTDALPFFIIPVVFQFINTRIIFSIVFLVISSILIIISEEGVFDAAILLIFSVYIFENNKFDIIALIIVSICISINSLVINLLPSQMFLFVKLYAYMYLIYFFTIRSDRKKAEESNIDYNLHGKIFLLPEEKELLKLLANGKNYKEIAQHFGKSQNTITNWKSVLLCKFQASSNEQLMFYFGKYSNMIGDSTNADN